MCRCFRTGITGIKLEMLLIFRINSALFLCSDTYLAFRIIALNKFRNLVKKCVHCVNLVLKCSRFRVAYRLRSKKQIAQRWDLLKVHVKLKDSDYLKFSEYQLTHSKLGKRTILLQRLSLPLVSVAMVIAFIVFHASTRALIIEIITLGIASAIWIIGAPGMLKRSMMSTMRKAESQIR